MGYGDEPLGGQPGKSARSSGFGGTGPDDSYSETDAIDRTVQELFGDRSSVGTTPESTLVDHLLDSITDESTTVEQRIELQETLRSILIEEVTDERIDSLQRVIDAVATSQRMLESDLEDLSVRVHRLERTGDGTDH